MSYSFFLTQWENPSKGDWTEQVKAYLIYFNIPIDFDYIHSKSKETFKKIVKSKSKELTWDSLMSQKENHKKLRKLVYTYDEMNMQRTKL